MKNQDYSLRLMIATAITLGMLAAMPALGAAPPNAIWARTVTGNAESSFSAMAIDASGNVYVAGGLRSPSSNPLDLGNGVSAKSIVPDRWSLMLAKYSPEGQPLWAKSVAGTPADSYLFGHLAVDSAGNVYAVGYIAKGTYDFGDGVTVKGLYSYTVSEGRKGNVILVKYNSSGIAQWARTVMACTDWSTFNSVAVDSADNIYCVGSIGRGVFDFGNGVSVTAGPDTDGSVVVLKYDSSGTVQWARTVPTGTGAQWAIGMSSLALDAFGNLYIAGSLPAGTKTFDFGNGVTAKGTVGGSTLLVKYDTNGMAQWARTSTLCMATGFNDVAVDPAGNVYVAGLLEGNVTVRFGNNVEIRLEGRDVGSMLLVKYDSSGAAQWARSAIQASSTSSARSVSIDSAGNVYLAGTINRDLITDFGNGVTVRGVWSGLEKSNALLVMYDPAGNAQWAKTVEKATANSMFEAMKVDAAGHIYVSGYIGDGTFSFGPSVTVIGSGSRWYNAFLMKY